ncbi:baculoviral IAP repeat-containing protein 1b-like isoform X2 [Ptychodera flava]|uniref:baculoviral IAP repeat-containing protein 1b-like isoform X2 n=1 Tax=Ptychodera flava TaxID=63121 RepID=UPI00396AB135
MAGIETGQSCQRQHNPSTQTDPRGSFESRSNAFDTEQPNSPRQATVEVSSDQTESDIDASGNTFEPISTNESRSDSFTQKLCGLAQEITDVTEISPNPGVTEAGQCNPPSMIPTNFESRSHLSQQTTDVSALAKLLKDKYKRHYSKLLPIPWNDEIHLNLHEVYTTLEVKKVKGVTHKMGEALENLHDMFKSSDDRRIRIEGAPAMGKSTLCRKLAYDWSCGELPQYTLLFFLEMRHVVEYDMIAEIRNQLIPDNFDLSPEELSGLLLKYETAVIFLCDGLDEVDEGHLTCTEIPRLISGDLYNWCTVVTTTRPHLCDKYLNACDVFLLVKGFTSKRTNEYILKYFKDDSNRGNLLIQQIKKQKDGSDFITDLLENPLHVSFLCILWEYHKFQGYSFPETLTELYSEILECILKRYCAKNKIELIDSELPKSIISEIDALASDSYSAYRNKKTTFDKSDISSEVSLNFGLLVKDLGHALRKFKEIYFFYHKTWLEYFTALHVSSQLISKNTKILQEFIKVPQKSFQILRFIAGNVTEETGSLFFTELNANLKKMHEKLQSLDTNCENMRKAFTPFKKFYPDCIKFLFESKYSKALITSFDVLRHESLVYTHGEPVLICRRNLFISDLKYQTHIKLDEKHCSFQNFLRLLQLISKTSMPLDTLCVLGSQIKKINSCLEILNGNPIHMKSLIIHSTTKWTRTDTDNLAGIITNFRGENISLSLNVDEGNGGSNSWLNNIIERIKENTSVKCFKFQANQSEDILQSMAQNGTQEIVYMDHSWSLKAASVNAVSTFLKNCDTTESFKVCIHHNDRSDLILNIKSALMRISPSLKSLHLLFTHHELCNALSANMTLNDIGMAISNETYESVFSVIKQNKYAKSMTIYDNYNFHGIDERWQSIAAALRENKVLKHLKIETMDDDDVLTAMNSLLIPVSKEIETNQVTLDSMTLRAFIEQNSSGCTGLQSIVSKQEKPDNWYHQVYPSVNSAYHYHLIRYTS